MTKEMAKVGNHKDFNDNGNDDDSEEDLLFRVGLVFVVDVVDIAGEALLDETDGESTAHGKLDEFHVFLVLAVCLDCTFLGFKQWSEYLEIVFVGYFIEDWSGDVARDVFHIQCLLYLTAAPLIETDFLSDEETAVAFVIDVFLCGEVCHDLCLCGVIDTPLAHFFQHLV